jgi:dTDP-4-dehydrorhamnose reductase
LAKVLICGSTGLLGCSLAPYLAALGHEIQGHGRTFAGGFGADLSSAEETQRLLASVRPEVVVNLVALTDVDACERQPEEAQKVNVDVVSNLVAGLRRYAPRSHLIQISTDQVYEGSGPHRETPVEPRNTYARSKLAGELVAREVASTVLRTNFFGRSLCPKRRSLSDWIVAELQARRPITVFEDIQFSPLSIATLVRQIAHVVEQRIPGVFNLGSRDGASKADFAVALSRVLDLPVGSMTRGSSDGMKFLAHRPKDMRMDSSAFANAFGVPLPSLLQEIESLRNAYPAP